MRITVTQLNYHVGNFDKNKKLIINAIDQAKNDKSDLVIFSELAVCGYPPQDLLEHKDFIDNCNNALSEIASISKGIAVVIGAPSINTNQNGKNLFNSAYFLADGRIKEVRNKSLLPTYDIFDECRYFEPFGDFSVVEYMGHRLALTICEDLWDEQEFDNVFTSASLYNVSPMDELVKEKPDIIINLSASPFSASRTDMRNQVFTGKARKHNLPLFMSNQVGANTELIFEGASMIISPDGGIHDQLPSFKEAIRTYDLKEVCSGSVSLETEPDRIGLIHDALVSGISDYFNKMNFSSAILGLSGGIDSAVAIVLASTALGKDRVRSLLLPSMYSSKHSVDDAVVLARNLGIQYNIINIEDSYRSIVGATETLFTDQPRDVTEENIQARIRSVILMAVSNKFGNILLNTSNKSEAAVGYSTLYGDLSGGLSVLGDVYKTDVYRLANYINLEKEIIPVNTITKPPSAELRPDQKDTDSLPDYDTLDSILYQYVELQKPVKSIKGKGITTDLVRKIIRMINASEYKRFQAPPILRISSKAFGIGRRMPLVAKY
jgi:NAD+ synthase (glutamine-hydrolysing)